MMEKPWDFFLPFVGFVCLGGGWCDWFVGFFFLVLQKEHIVAYLGLHLPLHVKHLINRS